MIYPHTFTHKQFHNQFTLFFRLFSSKYFFFLFTSNYVYIIIYNIYNNSNSNSNSNQLSNVTHCSLLQSIRLLDLCLELNFRYSRFVRIILLNCSFYFILAEDLLVGSVADCSRTISCFILHRFSFTRTYFLVTDFRLTFKINIHMLFTIYK